VGSQSGEGPVIGIDVGGTKIAAGIVRPDGAIEAFRKVPTEPQRAIEQIEQIARELLTEAPDTASLGIGMPAQVDSRTGTVVNSVWLDLRDVPLGPPLTEALGIPVAIHNDVNAHTWGEYRYGAGQGDDPLVGLFLGTGIGGGVIQNGALLRGDNDCAAELGHISVDLNGRICKCGAPGCIEAYASGSALGARARDLASIDPEHPFLLEAGSLDAITGETVSAVYAAGDPQAEAFITDTANHLAAGVVNILHAFNPRRIVFGGSVITGIPDLVTRVERRVREIALPPTTESVSFVTTELGERAGILGAADLSRSARAS
jgi:glucokinase